MAGAGDSGAGGVVAGAGGSDAGGAGQAGDAGQSGAGGQEPGTCGDGILDKGEECDEGGTNDPTCNSCQINCIDGFASNDSRRCYYILPDVQPDWFAARAQCRNKQHGCDLAVIPAANDRKLVASKLSEDAWIGAFRSESSWGAMPGYSWVNHEQWSFGPSERWLFDKSGEGPDAAFWEKTGDPDNPDSQFCLRLNNDTEGSVADSDCLDDKRVVCSCEIPRHKCNHNGKVDPGEECDDNNSDDGDGCSKTCVIECPPNPEAYAVFKDPKSHHCYALLKQGGTHQQALSACAALGGGFHLATLENESEFIFLSLASYDETSNPRPYALWIDASDAKLEGAFESSQGTKLVFKNNTFPWRDGEPNDSNENEDCADLLLFSPENAFLLNDSDCANSDRVPLCERD